MPRPLTQVLELLGTLDDAAGASAPREKFRSYLRENLNSAEEVRNYLKQAMDAGDLQKVRALQDLINYVGERLGFRVIPGRYHGENGPVVIDGHWVSKHHNHLLVEVRGAEDYRINPQRLSNFGNLLRQSGKFPSDGKSAGLYVLRGDDPQLPEIAAQLAKSSDLPLRHISIKSLIGLLEGFMSNEFSHEDVENLIFDGDIDLDSGLSEMLKKQTDNAEVGESSPPENVFSPGPARKLSGLGVTPRRRTMEEVNALLAEVKQADLNAQEEKEDTELPPPVEGHPQALEDIPVFSSEELEQQLEPASPKAVRHIDVDADEAALRKSVAQFELDPKANESALDANAGGIEWGAIGEIQVASSAGGGGVVYNASLDPAELPDFPELPDGPWSEGKFGEQNDALFNAVTRKRKKPFIKFAAAPSRREAEKPVEEEQDNGMLGSMIAGLGLTSNPVSQESDSGPIQAGSDQQDVATEIETTDMEKAEVRPDPVEWPEPDISVKITESTTPEKMAPVAQSAESASINAEIETNAVVAGLVSRLWPHPEFQDFAAGVMSCGGSAHELSTDAMLELAFLTELHRMR